MIKYFLRIHNLWSVGFLFSCIRTWPSVSRAATTYFIKVSWADRTYYFQENGILEYVVLMFVIILNFSQC